MANIEWVFKILEIFVVVKSDMFCSPGRNIFDAIFEAMNASRKVVVILSRHYLMNDINLIELDQAATEMYAMNIENIIILHINGVSEIALKFNRVKGYWGDDRANFISHI